MIDAPTLDSVKLALRVDGDAADTLLPQLIATATERANRQAPDAPAATGRQAIMQAVGWLFESPGIGSTNAGWWRRSGAESTLAPWTVRRAGAVG